MPPLVAMVAAAAAKSAPVSDATYGVTSACSPVSESGISIPVLLFLGCES